jgi:hypothetical protein
MGVQADRLRRPAALRRHAGRPARMPDRRRSSRLSKAKGGAKTADSKDGKLPLATGFSFSSSPGGAPTAAGSPAPAQAQGVAPVKFSFGAAAPVGAAAAGGSVFIFGACQFLLLMSDDLLMRVMTAAGPRWTRLLGAACKRLHALSTRDELWKVFWMRRAAVPSFFPPPATPQKKGTGGGGAGEGAGAGAGAPSQPPEAEENEPQWRGTAMPKTGIAAAYAKLHTQPRPPRQAKVYVHGAGGGTTAVMEHIWCNKRQARRNRWGGGDSDDDDHEWMICGTEATVGCDWPGCPEARCHRHELPREDYDYDDREEFEYKPPRTQAFASCSWCKLEACPAHASGCGWRRCDMCDLVR